MIEKLAAGEAVFGPIISDFSQANARTWARSGADYVWIDMEHNPMNLEAIANFIAYSSDRAYTAKRGDAQPKMAIVAPAMLSPSLLGARIYVGLSEAAFRRTVLALLTCSGVAMLAASVPGLFFSA